MESCIFQRYVGKKSFEVLEEFLLGRLIFVFQAMPLAKDIQFTVINFIIISAQTGVIDEQVQRGK